MTKAMLLLLLLLGACATTGENQCSSANWYERGHAEALMGNQPAPHRYAACSGFQEKEYMAGWSIGYSEWNQRTSGSRM